jgi:hypothetical protein
MAEQTRQATRDKAQDPNAGRQARQPDLRGGTEGGEAARGLGPNMKGAGTPGLSAPSGDVHVESPSRAVPRTDMTAGAPEPDTARLAGGKAVDALRGYLGDVSFPAKKDALVRAARRNGAPEDVLGAMNLLTRTEYGSFDELVRDYPRLPDRDAVEPNKGKT